MSENTNQQGENTNQQGENTNQQGENTNKQRKKTIPEKEADLIHVARKALAAWGNRPHLTLVWTTPETLSVSIEAFNQSFDVRLDAKGTRKVITNEGQKINEDINKNLKYLKDYIAERHGRKSAPSHYGRFGIVKVRGRYILPTDQDKRLKALNQMLTGIATENFDNNSYGMTFWTDLRDRFEQMMNSADSTDQTSSENVSVKKVEKTNIRKTLNALIYIIKGNYPDTWRDELRVWGFQKEKY